MLVLAVVVGATAFLLPEAREPDAPPPVSDFAHLRSGDVTRVEMKAPGAPFVLVKQGGKWMFEQPGRYRASSESVQSWLKSLLEDATVNRTVEGTPDASATGFDRPTAELVLAGRGDTRTLQVGNPFRTSASDKAPSVYYARELRDGRPFMLATSQVEALKDKKTADLREKRLLDLPDEKGVQRIALQRAAGPLEVEKRGEERWELLQPFRAPADRFDVESLISQLKSAEAASFVADGAADLKPYGLVQPRLTLQVTTRTGQQVVLFGLQKGDQVYAARQGSGEVTLVSKSTFDGLDKKPADLRDRKLITLNREKISFVELRNSHGTVRLQKAGSDWQVTVPGDPKPQKAKSDTVQTLLNSVTAPASRHIEEAPKDLKQYGLVPAAMTVQVNEGAGTSQVFLLGKKSAGGNYYAKGAPDAVFEVQPYVFADLNVKPEAFKEAAKK